MVGLELSRGVIAVGDQPVSALDALDAVSAGETVDASEDVLSPVGVVTETDGTVDVLLVG